LKAKPTAKELHDYCVRAGITAKIAGKPINKLIEEAHASDDPKAFLAMFAPGDGRTFDVETESDDDTQEETAIPEVQDVEFPEISIVVPFDPNIAPNATVAGDLHLDVQLRRVKSQRAFKKVWSALIASNAKLVSGRPVYSMANVVEWVIEQIANELNENPTT
jgi:hypothetical protein